MGSDGGGGRDAGNASADDCDCGGGGRGGGGGGVCEGEEEGEEEEEEGEGAHEGSRGEDGERRSSWGLGLGKEGFIVAGSDCGGAMVYCRRSMLPLARLQADEDVCNCVRPNPCLPILATSGIERCVRLWKFGPPEAGVGSSSGGGSGRGRVLSDPRGLRQACGRNSRGQGGRGRPMSRSNILMALRAAIAADQEVHACRQQ